jgi:hypothetical protein
MSNILKATIVIIIALAFSATTFYVGVLVGTKKFEASIENNLRLKIINELADRLGELPSANMNETPKNILWGTINQVDSTEIVVIAKPHSVADALWQEPKVYKIKITPETKIFYLSLDTTVTPYPSLPNATVHDLKTSDLRKDEYVYIKLDPDQTNNKLKALEIKVNR